ncbi:Tctex-1 family protein [Toxoplasma gondii TgCatPRC2]|uniref:Tctex-1 family protein n=13 Tax=Toxoplasma gondii TaxID=5811 RepID=A0A125YNW6_TOXGV|nr:Tctex-1 family protein [Toxoplasma gondii ME49]EPR63867.1 Tctex-1 family protein [Toxoplasma gondii GT1]ESS34095.1 Tctex-1 family protein [Toxoplasma gondii VEG]KAF4638351.1 Tctex-1 family protein [Toxoplasma gondii]KFG37813.1 Tctex-1 family protein [Toxoplasma gondii p89]KFG64731.1 Tctex-1 family protein [Toxoplasma gondii RUB]KFH05290.1 Tctex-1 family protein [Toxoplasma gondii VAND]KFH15881.1 Tctex-1 family protein [Toxoplasma gondii MAS]KYF48929.1 Tctex-1 family protein [Toxoplasma g|eukprot:XP_018634861.1 Tctex-1 family protein [Toxoplasma gondii ME49]
MFTVEGLHTSDRGVTKFRFLIVPLNAIPPLYSEDNRHKECMALKDVLDQLQDVEYDEGVVSQWVNNICEECSRRLVELKKPFKYIVQTAILQRTGAGLHAGSSCFWEPTDDGAVVCLWPRERLQNQDKKGGVQACVIVYVISL